MLVFLIEAILKLTALGILQYFRDGWNTFDFIVTALGVIELSVENVQGLSVLRAFRLVSCNCVSHQSAVQQGLVSSVLGYGGKLRKNKTEKNHWP